MITDAYGKIWYDAIVHCILGCVWFSFLLVMMMMSPLELFIYVLHRESP